MLLAFLLWRSSLAFAGEIEVHNPEHEPPMHHWYEWLEWGVPIAAGIATVTGALMWYRKRRQH